jgi:hypothetical protein
MLQGRQAHGYYTVNNKNSDPKVPKESAVSSCCPALTAGRAGNQSELLNWRKCSMCCTSGCVQPICPPTVLPPPPPQELQVKLILQHVMASFKDNLVFRSVHSAVLRPHRLAHWLEAAAKLAMPVCQPLLEAVIMLVNPTHPASSAMQSWVPWLCVSAAVARGGRAAAGGGEPLCVSVTVTVTVRRGPCSCRGR